MAIPKPKHCNQDWLDMKPTDGGRICGACEKTIVDFSRMKWKEIELIQTENGNSVCGMYTDRQLTHWGKEPKRAFFKLPSATASSLILMLAQLTAGDSVAQTTPEIQIIEDSTVTETPVIVDNDSVNVELTGHVYREADRQPAMFAKVIIKSDIDVVIGGAYVDEEGRYLVQLRYPLNLIRRYTLVISYEGQNLINNLSHAHEGIVFKDYEIPPNEYEIISFSIQVPPTKKWKRKRYDRRLKRQDKKNEE